MRLTLAPFLLLGLVRAIYSRQTATIPTMGFVGWSMPEKVAQVYVAVGEKHVWGPYGTGGPVVQPSSWQLFDRKVTKYGVKPTEVWIMLQIFQNPSATYDEVKKLVANARQHAAPGARIYITGQPVYPDNPGSCFLAGAQGRQMTVDLAKKADADARLNVTYPGEFKLLRGEV